MKKILTTVICLVAAFVLIGLHDAHAVTISDNFNDLDDTNNPAWTHLTGDANSTGQTFSAATGEYRLTAPANGFITGGVQYGFAGSYVGAPATTYTDVTVEGILTQPASGLFYGVAARLNGNNAFNALKGYLYAFEQNISQPAGVGEMVMFDVNGLNVGDMGNDGPASRFVTLDLANKDYWFRLYISGNTLHGKVREFLNDGNVEDDPLVAYQTKTDLTVPYASGFSGVAGVGAKLTQSPFTDLPLDFTIDNFNTFEAPEPTTSLLLVCGAGAMLLSRRRRKR